MMMDRKILMGFALGILSTLGVFYIGKAFKGSDDHQINKDYDVLVHQLSKLNKMIVLEQNYSSFQTHKSHREFAGLSFFPKALVLYTTAKAQVTYDLQLMKVEVDKQNKRLVIKQIPEPEIKIFPDLKIHAMDDSMFNSFDQESLNQISQSAKANLSKSINQNQLKQEAKKQLMANLSSIFVLAKALNYTLVDESKSLNLVDL
jgi:Protein of unknown function (DUF4230)